MLTYDPMELAWDRFLKQDNNTLLDFFEDIIDNWGDWEGKLEQLRDDGRVPRINPQNNNPTLTIFEIRDDLTSDYYKQSTLNKLIRNQLGKIYEYLKYTADIPEGLAGLASSLERKKLEEKYKKLENGEDWKGFLKLEEMVPRQKGLEADLKKLREPPKNKKGKPLWKKGAKVDLKSEFENLLKWPEFTNKLMAKEKSEGTRVNLNEIKNILNGLVAGKYEKSKNYFITSTTKYTGKLQGVADISGQLKGWRTKLTKLYDWVRDFKDAISTPKGKETYFRGDEQFDSRQDAINKIINQLDDKLELDSLMRLWPKGENRFSKERFSNMANKENNIDKKNKLNSIALALGQEGNRELLKSEEKILLLLKPAYTGDEEQYKGKTYLEILQFEFGQRGKPLGRGKVTPSTMRLEQANRRKLSEKNITYNVWVPTRKEFEKESVKSRFKDWNEVNLKELKEIRELESIIAFLQINNEDVEGYSDKEREKEELETKIESEYVESLKNAWAAEKPTPKTESDEPKNPFKVRQ